jgi:uncharacterized protein
VIVVSDTSPITNLAAVGHLQLLRQLYGEVVTPLAVFREMTIGGAERLGGMEVQTPEWIEVREVTDRTFVIALQMELDVGEAEAIALPRSWQRIFSSWTSGAGEPSLRVLGSGSSGS